MSVTFQGHIDRSSGKKLYLQLADIIKAEVEDGRLAVGSQLPSEDALCEHFNISKAVVRQALSDLAREGYLRKVQGKGTYIEQPPRETGLPLMLGLAEFDVDFGSNTTVRVVEKKVTVPPSEVRELFKNEYVRTTKVVRLVSARQQPVLLDTLYVPETICPGLGLLDLRQQSFYDLMEKRYHHNVERVAQSFDHTVANENEAQMLECESGDVLLLMDRILYGESDVPMAFSRTLCVTERGRLTSVFFRR